MEARHFHIEGIVQGVGFRPYVYLLAHEFGLSGWVNNTSDGVHIEVEGDESVIEKFITTIIVQPPDNSRITNWTQHRIEPAERKDFQIVNSDGNTDKTVLLAPDQAMCKECEKELHDPSNPRYRYPFITCTHCGPRYSIIRSLPYDRENTTMDEFYMCKNCREEYNDIMDRRYYSQTNSCHECGVSLTWNGIIGETEELLQKANEVLNRGEILAIKGIGGYLLLCDATKREVINKLRTRKKRPSKPLAVLYPDERILPGDIIAAKEELVEYRSVASPIVLFKVKPDPSSGIAMQEIAPGLSYVGAMKPYAPLLSLIARDFGKPLIATSANMSGSPIMYRDEEIMEELNGVADAFLGNDRKILMSEDDSVVRYSPKGKRIILRRSRGIAPNYFEDNHWSEMDVLAMGGSLKSTYFIKHAKNSYVSQYLGDQDTYESQLSYQSTLDHMVSLLDFGPELILADKHPRYSTADLGRRIASEHSIQFLNIQHHEAHFASVLAENRLTEAQEPVLGVVWDGTGYGNDKNIWGGEFFLYANHTMKRLDHFRNYSHILGDKMPKEPRISALSILKGTGLEDWLEDKFESNEWKYYHKQLERDDALLSSSVGRIFDAAACILGLGDKITYEGEAAMRLEDLALRGVHHERVIIEGDLLKPATHLIPLIQGLKAGVLRETLAFNFHWGMVRTIENVALESGSHCIAFSGGVFQNSLLLDLITDRMGNQYRLYFHKNLSPNDENVAYGQWAHFNIIGQEIFSTLRATSKPLNHLNT